MHDIAWCTVQFHKNRVSQKHNHHAKPQKFAGRRGFSESFFLRSRRCRSRLNAQRLSALWEW